MVRWLSRFFNYLDRYYIQRHNLHPLNDVGLLVFRGGLCALASWRCTRAVPVLGRARLAYLPPMPARWPPRTPRPPPLYRPHTVPPPPTCPCPCTPAHLPLLHRPRVRRDPGRRQGRAAAPGGGGARGRADRPLAAEERAGHLPGGVWELGGWGALGGRAGGADTATVLPASWIVSLTRSPPGPPASSCCRRRQVGMGQMECYERDFEDFMLKETAEYYRRKAAIWIQVSTACGGGERPGKQSEGSRGRGRVVP